MPRPCLHWLMLGTAVAVLLVTCGCASTVVPATVEVPIPVPCMTEAPPRPPLPSASMPAAADEFERAKVIKADRLVLLAHVETLEKALESCN